MPLPRFDRLSPARREEILRIARISFAQDGPAATSYNQIIKMAGISKTAAYQYFDGRDDLLSSVLADVRARLIACLGRWTDAATTEDFWHQLRSGAARLRRHLAEHPDDLALADAAEAAATRSAEIESEAHRWLAAVVANGRALGVVRADIDPALLLLATAAVFRTADRWLLAALHDGRADVLEEQLWILLAGLWNTAGTGEGVR